MEGKKWGTFMTDKIMTALEIKSANERISNGHLSGETQWIDLAKGVFSIDRELCHYQKFLNNLVHEDSYMVTPPARGIMNIHIPLYWNEGKETKRILNTYNIYAYIEVVHGSEFIVSDSILIDQTNFDVYNTVINIGMIDIAREIKGTLFLHIIPKLYVERLLNNKKSGFMKTFSEHKITKFATFTGNIADGLTQACVLHLQNRNTELVAQPFFEMCRLVSFQVELLPASLKSNIVSSYVIVSGDDTFNGYYFIGEGKVVLSRRKYWNSSEGDCVTFSVDDFLELSKSENKVKSFSIKCGGKNYTLSFHSVIDACTFLNICADCHKIKAEWDHYTKFQSKDAFYGLLDQKTKQLISNAAPMLELTRSKTMSQRKLW